MPRGGTATPMWARFAVHAAFAMVIAALAACNAGGSAEKSISMDTPSSYRGVTTSEQVSDDMSKTAGTLDWSHMENMGAAAEIRNIRDSGLSCPSLRLCVAVDNSVNGPGSVAAGYLFTGSNLFSHGAWKMIQLPGEQQLSGISCPTVSFCAVLGDGVWTSTDPTGGVSAWKRTILPATPPPPAGMEEGGSYGIDCPSSSMCVVWGRGGVDVSADPTGGTATWHPTQLPVQFTNVYGVYSGVSCASNSFCVAYASEGKIATSANPTSASPTWTSAYIDTTYSTMPYGAQSNDLWDFDCSAMEFCAGIDRGGNVVTSTDPDGGADKWHVAELSGGPNVFSGFLPAIACESNAFCVVAGDARSWSTYDPMGGAPAWIHDVGSAPSNVGLPLLACPSLDACLLVVGEVYQIGTITGK